FSAYPNPVKDVLNISYTSEISSVRVINMIGQEVLSRNINATSSQVDMSHLSAGTYIVNVTVGDAIKTLKVVKQ
ncbi:MAG: T9SS type A sorting domain-containing protein, partial [Flavobacterium sp.]|nr:T9SS type A sorting domain-containing protein [Flavobacterium sp.]